MKTCLFCGKELTGEWQIKFCSCSCSNSYNKKGVARTQETKERISNSRKGKYFRQHSPRWNGGTCISKGYKYILFPEHPKATKAGYVLEHRLIMEKHIGRYLNENECVHHINENTLDNRIENLEVVSPAEHVKIHHKNVPNKKKAHFGNTYRKGKKDSIETRIRKSESTKKLWKKGIYDKSNNPT